MSNLFIIILFAIITIAIIIFGVLAKAKSIKQENKLYNSKALLTANEIEFFTRLIQALPDYHVFPQVALGALLQPNAQGVKSRY